MTAIGKDGQPVPVPIGVRVPFKIIARGFLRRALVWAAFFFVTSLISPLVFHRRLPPIQVNPLAAAALFGLCFGFLCMGLDIVIWFVNWPLQRKTLGMGLEATADKWSLSELEMHIRNVQAEFSKATGYRLVLHSRHLAWLEARRELRVRDVQVEDGQ